MDLLIEAGYAYMGNGLADDIPHYWVTDFASRRVDPDAALLLSLRRPVLLDVPVRGTGLEHADILFRNWRAEFDAQYRRGRMFKMTLHPQQSVGATAWRGLEDFLAHMTSMPGLWNPTGAECARYWAATYPAATPEARTQHLEGLPRQPQLTRLLRAPSNSAITRASSMRFVSSSCTLQSVTFR